MTLDRFGFACVLALTVSACADAPSAATPSAQAPPQSNPDQVVAEVNGRKVTLKDVDAKWEEFDAAERARVTQALYQNRRNMLNQLVGDILIEDAAKAAGQSVAAFLKQDAARRAQPVTEQDLTRYFDENKDQLKGRTFEQLRAPMKEYLESQRALQARAQLVDELNKGAALKVMLEPPRYAVEVSPADPVRGDATAAVTLVEFSDYQ